MAWNDPDWGRKNSGGPPDLDELWRRFTQKLSRLFSRKGGRPEPVTAPPGDPRGLMPKAGVLKVAVGMAFGIWAASGFYIVDAGERGVVLRFGKYVEATEPGPRWHIPYPIESAEIVLVDSIRTDTIGYQDNERNKVLREALILTDDENIIDLQFAVQWNLKDPRDYLFASRDPEQSVKQVAESAIREIVGKNRMDFVLYEGRTEIAARAEQLIQRILDRYKTGVRISKVTMQNAQPPEQVQAAFDDAVKANQDKERQINEGQAYANDVIPRAAGAAARLLQEANGYRQRVIATAEGDASRFKQILAEYEKAPRVTRDRLYLDAMQQILANTTKILIDQKSGGNLLMLPLDKLIQSTGALLQ
ncbi:MAG: FtsH protease activity modulator HflK, partial [Burkholderiales bacterium]